MSISIEEALKTALDSTVQVLDEDDKCWQGLVQGLKAFHNRTLSNNHNLTTLQDLRKGARHIERAYLNKAIGLLDETAV